MKTIETPQGDVRLLDPEPARLRHLRQLLPFGAIAFADPPENAPGARYGIVMKCGDQEAFGIKQQPVEVPTDSAHTQFLANSILIAHTLLAYRLHGFSGLLMPCAYLRDKGERGAEVGFAYFGGPSPTGIESNEFDFEPAWDRQFGHGFTTMFTSFIPALKHSAQETGLTLQPCIGLDVRPRLALGQLGFGFLVHGQDVYALKTRVSEQDPAWTALRATGIDVVYHLPSVPMEIREDQLEIAKPKALATGPEE